MNFFSRTLFLITCFSIQSHALDAPSELRPPDLNSGDTFYVIFVTSSVANYNLSATSDAIDTDGVNSAAAGALTNGVVGWRSLYGFETNAGAGTRNTMDAAQAWGNVTDRPIYTTTGVRVANNRADMLDNTLLAAIGFDEDGNTPTFSQVFTGLNADGSLHTNALGHNLPTGAAFGVNNSVTGTWLALSLADVSRHLYVLSPLLTVPTPTSINSATYSAVTGSLAVTGASFTANPGPANDVDVSAFTVTGEGGGTYTLIDSADVEIDSATSFIVTLSNTDKTAVDALLNKNGTLSQDATVYNLGAADDFMTAVTDGDTSDSTITLTVTVAPMISSATYNLATGDLVVTGINFAANPGPSNDVDISLLTLTGEDGSTHALTGTADVDISSASEFTVTLSGADKTAVDTLLNKNGTSSVDNTAYNLAAADDFMAAVTDGNTADLTGNAVTVAGVPLTLSNLRLRIAATVDSVVTEMEVQGQVIAVNNGELEAEISVPASLTNVDIILRDDAGNSITKTIQLGEQ